MTQFLHLKWHLMGPVGDGADPSGDATSCRFRCKKLIRGDTDANKLLAKLMGLGEKIYSTAEWRLLTFCRRGEWLTGGARA